MSRWRLVAKAITATTPAMPTVVATIADRSESAPRPRAGSTARPAPITTGAGAPDDATRSTMRDVVGVHDDERRRGDAARAATPSASTATKPTPASTRATLT